MIDKKTIDYIKKQNGNKNFTEKELLWYLIHKVDNLDGRIDKQVGICQRHFDLKADKKTVFALFSGLLALLTGVICVLITI